MFRLPTIRVTDFFFLWQFDEAKAFQFLHPKPRNRKRSNLIAFLAQMSLANDLHFAFIMEARVNSKYQLLDWIFFFSYFFTRDLLEHFEIY